MFHPVHTILTGLTAATALVLSAPGAAHAATGTFTFHTQPGNIANLLNNPTDGQCYSIGNAGGAVGNNTNRDALLYATANCTGSISYNLAPGAQAPFATFRSVKFVR
jgi:hypothetical protein